MAIDFSGDRRCNEPSMWLLKVTPASSIFRRSDSENTWKPPEVGQDGVRPAHELVQPAQCRYQLVARAQVEMVRVGKHQAGADLFKLSRCDRLNGGLCANWGKDRGEDIPVGGAEDPCPGAANLSLDLEGKRSVVIRRLVALHKARL